MIDLPHGCKRSEIAVHPTDWQTSKASVKQLWYINYRFYDAFGRKKQVVIRGMNRIDDYSERKKYTEDFIKQLKQLLLNGFNPISNQEIPETEIEYAVSPSTPFIQAITKAKDILKCSQHTRDVLNGIIRFVEQAAKVLKIDTVPVNMLRRRHMKQILLECQATRNLSPGNYNHYRAYLMMIFNELVELETIDTNPVAGIQKQKEVKKIRQTLTEEERKLINDHLHKHHRSFWRYLHIFFHSGSRTTELLRLKGKDVNLKAQYFKRTIIKGAQHREVKTMIKDIALPLWEEVMKVCKPEDFVFSIGLKPGEKPLDPHQISVKWSRYVKNPTREQMKDVPLKKTKSGNIERRYYGLNIKADFYSVKHLHSDQVSAVLGIHVAGAHNSHTSTKTTRIYAVNEAEREAARLKKLGNTF